MKNKILLFGCIGLVFWGWKLLLPSQVLADVCVEPSFCDSPTRLDVGVGCDDKITYCSTLWESGLITCTGDCTYSTTSEVCADDATPPDCKIKDYTHQGTCCSSSGGDSDSDSDSGGDSDSDSGPGCVPSCNEPLCGQNDGCGGTCSDADAGEPIVEITQPEDGQDISVSQGEAIIVSWIELVENRLGRLVECGPRRTQPDCKAEEFEVLYIPNAAETCEGSTVTPLHTATKSLQFIPEYSSYRICVRGINTSCYSGGGCLPGSRPETGEFDNVVINVFGEVSGTVYEGITCKAGTGFRPNNSSTVRVYYSEIDYQSAGVASDGRYTVTGVPLGAGYLAYLINIDDYSCVNNCVETVDEGCRISGVSSPSIGNDFNLSIIVESWFQIIGGSLHVNNGAITSQIPGNCCDDPFKPYLILSNAVGAGGLASCYNSSISCDVDWGKGDLDEAGKEWEASTKYSDRKTGFGYFHRILEDDVVPWKDWNGTDEPEGSANNGVYPYESDLVIGGWNIGAGESYVILAGTAEGDETVTINNNITVEKGGFLGVIAKGGIIIEHQVTEVHGVYITDGELTVKRDQSLTDEEADVPFKGEGVFAGLAGVRLERDLVELNASRPAEQFEYRTDLVINAYKYLTRPTFTWKEVAP